MGEPLWRGPLRRVVGGVAIPGPFDDEVEVWRAGDRPVPPTRDQVWDVLADTWTDEDEYDLNVMADAVMELLSGQVPTEPEETHDD